MAQLTLDGDDLALVRNGRTLFQSPGFQTGNRSFQSGNFIKGGLRNRFIGGYSQVFGAYPSGYLAPSAFVLPQKSGAISSFTQSQGALSSSANLIPARNLDASASITLSVTQAQLDQIVSLIASAATNLSVSNAQLVAAAQAVAVASSSLSISTAQLGAIFSVLFSASGSLSGSGDVTAIGHMQAQAGGPTPLSPEGLAEALLNSILADFNDPGSVGEALNSIGAAGNPWSSDLASNNSPGTFGEKIQQLLTLAKFLGLK